MDRQLTKEEKNKDRRKVWVKWGVIGTAVVVVTVILLTTLRPSVNRSEIITAEADTGLLDITVQASGKVVPAYEEAIISPVTATIIEVYRMPGDSVKEGEPLLRLDLEATENEVNKQRDERQKQVYGIEQQRLDNETRLTNLEMSIRVKEMAVNRLEAEMANERRLDSIGSGTGDRVREAELAYKTGRVELEQLRRQLVNERKALSATVNSRKLDLSILDKNLNQQLRILEDAKLKAPRNATLTYINTNIGERVNQGEKIAALADLTHFRIDGEIAETNGKYLTNGGRATVRIARKNYNGRVVNVSPLSSEGSVKFSVIIDEDASDALRSGLSAEIYVVREEKGTVTRIPIGPYYTQGAGQYQLYVETSPGEIEKRTVQLGDANYEFVEVISGLQPGEKVVVSDMSSHKGNRYSIRN